MSKFKGKNGQNGRQAIIAIERRKKVMRDYIDKTYVTTNELAAKYGVAQSTISKDLSLCRRMLEVEAEESASEYVNISLKALERNQARFLREFGVSQQPEEEIRTTYEVNKCSECKGAGMSEEEGEEWCDVCDGSGTVMEEVVTRRVRGQAGDPRYLSGITDCIKERCRLKGLYPEKKREPRRHQHEHLHLHKDLDKEWEEASPELVLKARRLTLELEASKNGDGGDNKEGEGK